MITPRVTQTGTQEGTRAITGNRPPAISTLLAEALFSSWHLEPPPLQLSEAELQAISPIAQRSGAAGLLWWRLRQSHLRDTPTGIDLQQAYRLQTLHAARRELDIQRVFDLMRRHDIEPILLKGWSVARHYPAKGLRPYGDIDLYVRPDDYPKALALSRRAEYQQYFIDLWHVDLAGPTADSGAERFRRSQLVALGDTQIRILGAEDHLRMLCLHLLRHGAVRPLWFCDLGVALENRPADFDWDYCLGTNRMKADYVACAIGIAHQLLGAPVADTPIARRAERLPVWVVPAVLKEWERRSAPDYRPVELLMDAIRQPGRRVKSLRQRWINPIEASINFNAPFNALPRWPLQFADYLSRAAKYVLRLPVKARRKRPTDA